MDKFNTYKKNPSVTCTELDKGAVLLNLDNKYYYSLNETGLRIWQIVEEFHNPVEMSKRLADEYKVDTERVKAGVFKLITELEKEGLIVQIKGGD